MPSPPSPSSPRSPVRADDPAFTAVRGVAAFWVFLYHAWLTAGPQILTIPLGFAVLDVTVLMSAGGAGVDIFYVLSGFLLWGMFDDWAARRGDRASLRHYAERRALRILPPYYGQLLVLVVIACAMGDPPTFVDLAWHLVLLHGWSSTYWQSMNGVWWTLSLEAQFYVTLPLLAWIIRRTGWGTAIAIGLVTMFAWRIGAFHVFVADSVPHKVWGIEQLPGRIDQFIAGMFARHLVRAPDGAGAALRAAVQRRPLLRRALFAVGPVTLVALAYRLHVGNFFLRYWDGDPWLYCWHLVAGVAVAITLYALAIRPTPPGAALAPAPPWWERALVGFGVVSYSFFLWHAILLNWLQPTIRRLADGQLATPKALAVSLALGFIVSLAVARAWYLLFERPLLRTRARLRTQ